MNYFTFKIVKNKKKLKAHFFKNKILET
jgi:hypothetical protein